MAAPDPVATTLLTEHLSYTPLSLIDDIINALNALIYQSVAAVETFLLSAPPASLGFETARKQGRNPHSQSIVDTDDQGNVIYPEAEIELSQGIHALETLLEATIDKDFDKFEIYVLRNIFSIEEALLPWITLPHYKGLKFDGNQQPENISLETLKQQRSKLEVERKFKSMLEKEKAKNEALIGQLRALTDKARPSSPSEDEDVKMEDGEATSANAMANRTGPLSFLFNPSGGMNVIGNQADVTNPLADSSAFALTQLPYLKSVLERLRPFLEHKPDDEEDAQSEGANHTDDLDARIRYIENRTKIHIARQQENGATGLSDAEAGDWPGRRVATTDLQSLESFIKSMEEKRAD